MNATEYYREPIQKVLNELEVTQQGLTEFEVQTRRKQFGYNELKEGKRKSAVQIFLEQFTDFLVIILMIAAIISLFLGEVQSSIVILVVVILNAVLGTIQQIKAEKSLDSLKDMAVPIARVLRDGQVVEIPSKEVVVGDIVILDAGDYVCADGRIIESYSLQINESSLTGESLPIEKMANVINEEDVALGDKKNMVF
ncbi:ATPase, partial [Butyricicoccus sp. 1XD8-22]